MAEERDFDIVGARIFDGVRLLDADRVSVRDGHVVELGRGVAERPAGTVIDAGGRLLTPGFVDAHAHPVFAGIELLGCDLSGTRGLESLLEVIGGHLRRGTGWLTGGGWAMPDFPGGTPRAEDLDRLGTELGVDRPISLINRDHHSSWVNSRAMALAGLTAETPDPPGGVIERDAGGKPNGCLHESAMDLVGAHIPQETAEELLAGIEAGQHHLERLGVTAWMDAIVGSYSGHADAGDAYHRAAESGRLRAEVVGSLWWPRDVDDVDAQVRVMREARVESGRYRSTSVKFMLDGVVESKTAAMREPYRCACAGSESTTGTRYFTAAHLREAFAALDRAGFDIHCHAIGDGAVGDALDAFAAVGIRPDSRHHIAHVQVVDPADVPRFAQLGVAANLQALWACRDDAMNDLNLPVLGPERGEWQYPFGSLAGAGTRLAMGSDWPVSSADPWQAIHVAVNRSHPAAEDPAPLLPEQAIGLDVALAAYTSGSARLVRSQANGHIRVGREANLALASADAFALDPAELAGVATILTVNGGRIVHRQGI